MKKYQIVEISENLNHAGTKATADFSVIASKLGFERITLKMATTKEGFVGKAQRQIGYFSGWNYIYKTIEENAVVLLQEPFHYPQLTREKILNRLKNEKHVRFITVIHDVEELRGFRFNEYYRREFAFMLDLVDVIIVHNDKMKAFFEERGVKADQLISLEIFDYLQPSQNQKMPAFSKSITIAGNLDTTKCGYIEGLKELNNVKVNLYGPNFNEELRQFPHIQYNGSFPADVIPSKLTEGFGLVWDGNTIHGCMGQSGQYLKYNNPHKLSLYLSSGVPVVIWSEAAEAAFVKENGCGVCVKDLKDLDEVFANMTQETYESLCKNVDVVKEKLLAGNYGTQALKKALHVLER